MARPKGVRETKPRATAARKFAAAFAPDADISMPEIMRQIALRRWKAGDDEGALFAAEKAAPYFAPRLASTQAVVKADVSIANDIDRPPAEDREAWMARRKRDMANSLLAGPAAGTAD